MKVEKFHKEAVERVKGQGDLSQMPVTGFWEDTELGKLFGDVIGGFTQLEAALYLDNMEQVYEEVVAIKRQLIEVEDRLANEEGKTAQSPPLKD